MFLSNNQPARRYLYFRYLITFLHHRRAGNTEWAESLESYGYMWATPGAYLRKTMLMTLARKASDNYLPEVFWKSKTFDNRPDCPNRTAEEEEILTESLDIRLREKQLAVTDADSGMETEDEEDAE